MLQKKNNCNFLCHDTLDKDIIDYIVCVSQSQVAHITVHLPIGASERQISATVISLYVPNIQHLSPTEDALRNMSSKSPLIQILRG